MNCAEAAKKFADWCDAGGRDDMPIKVNATRRSIMSEAARSGIAIRPEVRGGALYLGRHEVIPIKEQ